MLPGSFVRSVGPRDRMFVTAGNVEYMHISVRYSFSHKPLGSVVILSVFVMRMVFGDGADMTGSMVYFLLQNASV